MRQLFGGIRLHVAYSCSCWIKFFCNQQRPIYPFPERFIRNRASPYLHAHMLDVLADGPRSNPVLGVRRELIATGSFFRSSFFALRS